MIRSPYTSLLVLIALLVGTALALTYGVDVRTVDEAGIRTELPRQVGAWRGESILYCQNPKCGKEFVEKAIITPGHCPACGGPLDTASLLERTLLPSDTIIVKKRYSNANGHTLYAAIVMSGADRASIHRPQLCLVGQGNEITGSRTVALDCGVKPSPRMMVLDLTRRIQTADGQRHSFDAYYAYWFAGRNRSTPYHVARMFWMGWDRIVHSVNYRWSYISVSGLRSGPSGDYQEEVKSFVSDLYPALALTES